tara:strand:+ start:3280 stop:4875 length:1596 start_codon:yes stop_codon:yes gene_type:complete
MKYFCILLRSDKKRVFHVLSHVVKKLPQVTIFPAIEGRTEELETALGSRNVGDKFLNFCRRGQLACLLSHLEVWKTMIQENIQEAVILEDDVQMPTNMNMSIPKDADFAYLYVHPDCKQEGEIGYKTYGTVAYYITLDLARELVPFFNTITTSIDDSISWYLERYHKKYYCYDIMNTVGSLYSHQESGIGSAIGQTDIFKTSLPIKREKTKAVLLTGGCGYIGSHTALEMILTLDLDIIIADNLSNSSLDVVEKLQSLNQKVYYYNLDVTQNIDMVFEEHQVDTVIHFAAYKSVGESVAEPLKYYRNNIGGLINVLETMQKFGVENIIFSSSATVYGMPECLPLTETSKLSTLNPYGRTKLFAEEILRDTQIKCVCLRYFNPVGATSSGFLCEKPKGIPNNLFPYILDVIRGKRDKLSVFGGDYATVDGTAIRDYIHVTDLAQGHVAALDYLKNDFKFEVFNLGTGNGYSVLEIVNKFSQVLGQEVNYEIVDRREGDSEAVYADCEKAREILNWRSKLSLEDMIKDTLNII